MDGKFALEQGLLDMNENKNGLTQIFKGVEMNLFLGRVSEKDAGKYENCKGK